MSNQTTKPAGAGAPADVLEHIKAEIAALEAAQTAPAAAGPATATTSAQLLAEYLGPRMAGTPQAVRAYVEKVGGRLQSLASTGRILTVPDVVNALLGD